MRWPVVLLAAALTACSGSESGYVSSAEQSAQEGLSAAGTLEQLVQAQGRLLPPYRKAAVDDVLSTATKALDDLESEPPPGPDAARVYDQVHPQLQGLVAAAGQVRDALDAGDGNRVTEAERRLSGVRDQLDAFVRSRQ
ncbi:hypothetical protein FHX82_003885 [Amycolatopsis bartoniae]|uniref:Lipoprotein n=1 Tax=Amycolatopsis bartoniae TaxID=941986 RepID=A0A8H9MAP0_9PSEU|nr:hypothetical protein [Amycolatopsis bartoniae]MBB2936821.1 hypothetical protein [Amycolatopsis bartoniae]TVT09138.1 hypothetical protein FNH07_09535 [Amycolatopsis bartoniae]GHF50379.1 hypothetical protein GCM10017566_24370 [Amycolatopsis bartoniae]